MIQHMDGTQRYGQIGGKHSFRRKLTLSLNFKGNTMNNAQNAIVAKAEANANAITEAFLNTAAVTPPAMKNVLIRKDLMGNNVVFDADSEDTEAKTIMMWDGVHGNGTMKAVPVEFYHKATKSINDNAAQQEAIKSFSINFGHPDGTVLIRQRLVKASVKNAPKDAAPAAANQVRYVDVQELIPRMRNAFEGMLAQIEAQAQEIAALKAAA